MLNKLFQFSKGYVIIEVTSPYAERFINICIRRGLDVRDISPVTDGSFEMCISNRDFKKLRPVAYKTHSRVKIKQKRGFAAAAKSYRKRYFFFLGALCFVVFFAVSSRFIWSVELDGIENADRELLISQLKENGIYVGAKKSALQPISQIKTRILIDNPSIAWLWVYIEGSKARVEVYEKIIPPDIVDIGEPCDIVAARDGVITHIDALRGAKTVAEHTAVSAGDVLISSVVPVFKEGYEEKYIQVHADGKAYAKTFHTKSGIYPKYYEARQRNGNSVKKYSVDFFDKTLCFYRDAVSPYENYDEEHKRFELKLPIYGAVGIALNMTEYSEVNVSRESVSLEYVEEKARYDLEKSIASELLPGAVLEESEIKTEDAGDENVKVTLSMTFTEQIGITRRVDKLDNQTNRGD